MPGYERAEVSAELKVLTSNRAENLPQAQVEAAMDAASETGLAHEAGPDTIMFAGSRKEVLEAVTKVLNVVLEAGAKAVEVKVKAEADANKF